MSTNDEYVESSFGRRRRFKFWKPPAKGVEATMRLLPPVGGWIVQRGWFHNKSTLELCGTPVNRFAFGTCPWCDAMLEWLLPDKLWTEWTLTSPPYDRGEGGCE